MTIISLGSNVDGAGEILARARRGLARVARIEASSGPYPAADDTGRGADYLNEVLAIDTDLTLDELESAAAGLERAAGRTPDSRRLGVMPLDIDVVVWRGEKGRPYDFTRPYFRHGYGLLRATLSPTAAHPPCAGVE